ncbi:hypothetical protein ABH908_000084 [Pseudomonas frederiksbergensis]|uniref:hypothetical protein n=1 Tax=Pseudomonas TaxID=286 RepID=UPI003D1F367A
MRSFIKWTMGFIAFCVVLVALLISVSTVYGAVFNSPYATTLLLVGFFAFIWPSFIAKLDLLSKQGTDVTPESIFDDERWYLGIYATLASVLILGSYKWPNTSFLVLAIIVWLAAVRVPLLIRWAKKKRQVKHV